MPKRSHRGVRSKGCLLWLLSKTGTDYLAVRVPNGCELSGRGSLLHMLS